MVAAIQYAGVREGGGAVEGRGRGESPMVVGGGGGRDDDAAVDNG
jgi:hypothetical protein